ncbi:MAG: hypothetical protein D8M57_18140 [Candidatus Scalindua sp. AMX11]|nr:MAG: hypothetical protein DWQ00_08230 [Candidatus Scalindua sp.]NOG83299.1 hypothetical protein [Planctomycetota bacterium]RZV76801.1 MAG: hypothetical protein EX341_12265 [Candidatus Scalindua sp. SCAELEC01]TDE63444.1 MAG: hypothetical protein D8M57_18140 [Candidatus Scalindua sp. AMX11]GJQ57485.1 MAG: hypothetical protein SCALA701_02860 [Candidatus Scalindua sp.]
MKQPVQTSLKEGVNFIKLNRLPNKKLLSPLDAIVEPDDDGYIARTTDLPLYSFGDDIVEAVDSLKHEIESLYNDLMENDEFTEDWLRIKSFLKERITDFP